MWTDLRFALRMWRRFRGTTATIVASVAVGIAAVSTIFSWTQGLILRPLPAVRESERLVSLKPHGPGGETSVAWEEFGDWQEQSASFEGTAAFGIRRFGLREPGTAPGRATEPVWGLLVSGNYFGVLGVMPHLGRLIDTGDARPGADVVVLSHQLWQRRFGASPDIIGRRMVINGVEVTIVGVAPAQFAGTYVGLSFDVWLPVTVIEAPGSPTVLQDRDNRWMQAFGRLRSGVSREQAAAETAAIDDRLAAAFAASRDIDLVLQPLDIGAASRLAPLISVLLGLAILVLVVVCATVSNLLMAQAATRETEMAVRLAIGAGPRVLLRQLLAESALLATVAGGLGALITVEARELFPVMLPPSPLPLAIDTPIDARVLAFAIAITTLSLMIFGLAPALTAVRRAAAAGLRTRFGGDRAQVRWRRALVAAQLAFSVTALASTAMFARRLVDLRDVDRGFVSPDRVLLLTTDLEVAGIASADERRNVMNALRARTRELPDVVQTTMASFVPLGFTGYREVDIEVPGVSPVTGEPSLALLSEVGPDYFDLMGITLVAGRPIGEADHADGQRVAVINEALVRNLAISAPLGQRLRIGGREVVVIGVARNGKYRFDELEEPAGPLAYVPWEQWGASELTLHVRTRRDPQRLVPALQRTFAAVDARLPVLTPMTLDAYTSLPLFPGRLATTVVGVLAFGALVLSALGLYGVTRFAVAARTRELGIRMALGAGPARVLGLLLSDSARFASIGLATGVALAFVVTRVMLALLPRLQADPLAVLAAGALLLVIFAAAVALAARRALRIDPAAALVA